MKKEKPTPNFHMTLSDRIVIEQGLREGKTFQDIAFSRLMYAMPAER